MPELPEVETIKIRLTEVLIGKTVGHIRIFQAKSFQGESESLLLQHIAGVQRRGKLLCLVFSNDLNLLIHLKMTGQLIYQDKKQKIGGGHPTADWTNTLPSLHTRVVITFTDNSELFFNDMRIFGWMRILTNEQLVTEWKGLGPDANDSRFTAKYLFTKLAARTVPIKQAIMMNELVAGVGNIYAAEALFVAQIDPRRSANSLNMVEIARLVKAIKQVIAEGIEYQGTTFDGKYVSVDGLAGSYQTKLRVYGRKGEKCLVCQQPITKIKLGGRGTYFCQQCQRSP
jgi:formamidopyrimidine-DNA glycosylase